MPLVPAEHERVERVAVGSLQERANVFSALATPLPLIRRSERDQQDASEGDGPSRGERREEPIPERSCDV